MIFLLRLQIFFAQRAVRHHQARLCDHADALAARQVELRRLRASLASIDNPRRALRLVVDRSRGRLAAINRSEVFDDFHR